MRYWDENLLQGAPPMEEVPQVVGISLHLTFAQRAYALAAWFKAHGCLVVMGGLHALSCPDEVQAHADAICVGNGVPVWPRMLRDIERGELKPRYSAEYRDYAADPPPDRSILPDYGFLTPASFLIRHRLTHPVWSPLVHLTRLRHLRYRWRLAREGSLPGHMVSPIRPSV